MIKLTENHHRQNTNSHLWTTNLNFLKLDNLHTVDSSKSFQQDDVPLQKYVSIKFLQNFISV